MSPKVDNSRLYGYFKIKIQKGLFSYEALPSNWSHIFSKKNWIFCNRTTITTHNSSFWVLHNHLFASCLPTNQEKQPTKTDLSLSLLLNQLQYNHPPYSPDLVPNVILSFRYVKSKLRCHRFSTLEEAVAAFGMYVLEIPKSEWQNCLHNRFKRMQKI